MKWFGIILLIIVALIFFTTIKIKLEYKRNQQDDRIFMEICVWANLLRLRYEIPVLKLKSIFTGVSVQKDAVTGVPNAKTRKKRFRVTREKVKENLRRVYRARRQIFGFNEIIKKMSKQVACERLEWSTKIGLGDAAATGMATGSVWALKTLVVGLMAKYMRLKAEPRLDVVPAYQASEINTELRCILKFRIGNIIIAGTRILFKLRKGREGLWQNILFRA